MQYWLFRIDWQPLLVIVLIIGMTWVLWKRKRAYMRPGLYFSALEFLTDMPQGFRIKLVHWPALLRWGALFLLGIALLDPTLYVKRSRTAIERMEGSTIPVEGIAIYLLLDQSGSMGQEQIMTDKNGQTHLISKLDLMKEVTRRFITSRTHDLIGLMSFARGAQILSPLTLDHRLLTEKLNRLGVIGEKEKDGTAIGYAIFKAVNLIDATRRFSEEAPEGARPSYTIENAIAVVITDGIQDPSILDKNNPLRTISVEEAAEYSLAKGVKLYLINVDPAFSSEAYAPYRRLMRSAAEKTGGAFYLVEGADQLQQIFQEVDRLEASAIPATYTLEQQRDPTEDPARYRRIVFAPYLLGAALCFLFGAVCLETLILREAI